MVSEIKEIICKVYFKDTIYLNAHALDIAI